MAYFPPTGSVVAYQIVPSSLLTGASIMGRPPVAVTNTPSISGTVEIGNFPAIQEISGSVVAHQGTTPWAISSVYGNISGSVIARNIIPSSLLVGASVVGHAPVVIVGGSIATATTNSSVMLLNSDNVIGSVTALQGTAPWLISSVYGNISGSVVAFQGTAPWAISSVYGNVSGSVLSQQLGTRITSVANSIPSSLLTGIYSHRNDAVASFLGADLTWRPAASDSAGRFIGKPFAADETRFQYHGSVVSGSVTLIAASVIGKKHYITDWIGANSGSVATVLTFQDGSTSIVARTILPGGGGSNAPGFAMPPRGNTSQDLAFAINIPTSITYLTVTGYTAP